ncbi:MAG: chromate transporter [Firmicutes bacterium]|nr:chromate transporter [Bacillota bacterium]
MLITPLLVFAKVGLLTIGGGLAMIPLLQEEIVSRGWITIDEFTQMISIAEMTPGPIIVNLATFVGYRLGGIPSAVACTLGVILPSFVVVTLISSVLFRHKDHPFISGLFAVVRPAVVGLIAGAGLTLARQILLTNTKTGSAAPGAEALGLHGVDSAAVVIFVCSMTLLARTRLHPAKVLAAGAVLGMLSLGIAGR